MDSTKINVIAFDVFGTVFNLSSVDKQEVRNYLTHIRQEVWQPLKLPKSWEILPAQTDAAEGLSLLRSKYFVVTCSNGPLGLLAKLSKHNGIVWDAIIPLEINKVYKPNLRAYLTVCGALDIEPERVLMVTANESFGDLEAARKVGMQSILINTKELPTIIELAKILGC